VLEMNFGEGSIRDMKVLVVDDELQMREVVEEYLSITTDCVIVSAASGDDGLRLNDSERPDVILLDMLMPGLNGFSVLEAVKDRQTHHRPQKIVAMSGITDSETVKEITRLGADFILAKPFTLQELRSVCETSAQ
jgi:CheY-like chemotaxis protein